MRASGGGTPSPIPSETQRRKVCRLTFVTRRLTWEGHELRDLLKNDNVWQRVKATIAEKGGGASIEIVKELAMRISKRGSCVAAGPAFY